MEISISVPVLHSTELQFLLITSMHKIMSIIIHTHPFSAIGNVFCEVLVMEGDNIQDCTFHGLKNNILGLFLATGG